MEGRIVGTLLSKGHYNQTGRERREGGHIQGEVHRKADCNV